MRFFARIFLLTTLLAYIFIIGFQLIPQDGSFGFVETIFRVADTSISSIKQFFFQDNELVTLDGPGGLEIPIPITVDLSPNTAPFTNNPPTSSPGRGYVPPPSVPPKNYPQTQTTPPATTPTTSTVTPTPQVQNPTTNTPTTVTPATTTTPTSQTQNPTTNTPPPPQQQVTPPQTSCHLDWCAPAVIRPEYKYESLSTCVPLWTTDEIAQYAKMVWFGQSGNELPTTNGLSYETTTCWGQLSLSKQRAYNDEIKAKAAALGRKVYSVNAFRFDIVTHSVMAQSGFNASWLVRPATPHQAYVDFYANDTSPVCGGVAGTCRLTYSRGVNQEGLDTGRRLRDMIDASGGAGAYRNVVYYVARPGSGDKVGWSIAALANQKNSAYRAWRVNQARQIVQEGNFDFVMLNHKFHFYKAENNWTTPAQSWLGGEWAPNVTALQASDDTPFSNPPLNYTYSDYVQGWHALGTDLRNAGVPYMVQSNGAAWVNPNNLNDPSTTIDEATLIRQTTEGAGLVEMDYQSWLSSAQRTQLDQAVRDLEARGIIVIKIRSECGYGSGTPTSCTTAQLQTTEARQLAQPPQNTLPYVFTLARITLLLAIVSLLFAYKKPIAVFDK